MQIERHLLFVLACRLHMQLSGQHKHEALLHLHVHMSEGSIQVAAIPELQPVRGPYVLACKQQLSVNQVRLQP